MAQMSILGGRTYNNPTFKAAMNRHYATVDAMKASLAILRAAPNQIDVPTLQFGQYQPILAAQAVGGSWMREMGFARVQLSAQPNAQALSKDEAGVVPLTKCDLLDACVRKCFNSQPDPIPMTIDVTEKNANSKEPDLHDILLVWDYGADDKPTRLHLTMVCPFGS
jgi:hypothetical protein